MVKWLSMLTDSTHCNTVKIIRVYLLCWIGAHYIYKNKAKASRRWALALCAGDVTWSQSLVSSDWAVDSHYQVLSLHISNQLRVELNFVSYYFTPFFWHRWQSYGQFSNQKLTCSTDSASVTIIVLPIHTNHEEMTFYLNYVYVFIFMCLFLSVCLSVFNRVTQKLLYGYQLGGRMKNKPKKNPLNLDADVKFN